MFIIQEKNLFSILTLFVLNVVKFKLIFNRVTLYEGITGKTFYVVFSIVQNLSFRMVLSYLP